jgi:hypothetical protein
MGSPEKILDRRTEVRIVFAAPHPAGLLGKLARHRQRYGTIHALARFAATKVPGIWPVVGLVVTRRYRGRWKLKEGGSCSTWAVAAGFTEARHSTYKDPASELGFLDSHADRFSHDPLLSQYVEARRSVPSS